MRTARRGGFWESDEGTCPGPRAWRRWMADILAVGLAMEPRSGSSVAQHQIRLPGITTLLGISAVPFLMRKAAVMKLSIIRALPVLARTLRTFNIPPRLRQVPPPGGTTISGHLALSRIPFLTRETS